MDIDDIDFDFYIELMDSWWGKVDVETQVVTKMQSKSMSSYNLEPKKESEDDDRFTVDKTENDYEFELNSMVACYRPFYFLFDDFYKSMILSHFLYITSERHDAQKVIEEENRNRRIDQEIDMSSFDHGWFGKRQKDIQKELMLEDHRSIRSIRDDLKYLEENKFIFSKSSPYSVSDQTKHYRVNIQQIERVFNDIEGDLTLEGSNSLPFTVHNGDFIWTKNTN